MALVRLLFLCIIGTVVKGGSADVATGKRRMSMQRRSAFYPSYALSSSSDKADHFF